MWYFICFIAGCIVTSAIILSISNRRINRANSQAAVVADELSRVRKQFKRATDTLGEIRRIQSTITSGLSDNNAELLSVIQRLYRIRDQVKLLEDLLGDYYSHSGSDINLYDTKNNK